MPMKPNKTKRSRTGLAASQRLRDEAQDEAYVQLLLFGNNILVVPTYP
jgi:hypothetical protein